MAAENVSTRQRKAGIGYHERIWLCMLANSYGSLERDERRLRLARGELGLAEACQGISDIPVVSSVLVLREPHRQFEDGACLTMPAGGIQCLATIAQECGTKG